MVFELTEQHGHEEQDIMSFTRSSGQVGSWVGRRSLALHLRDIAVLKQQGFVSESRFEAFAQVRLGLAPELGFVAL